MSSATSTSSSRSACLDLVVPDLDLDAAVQRAALRRSHSIATGCVSPAHSYEIASGGSVERRLEELGHLAGALARQARVVAEHARQRRPTAAA